MVISDKKKIQRFILHVLLTSVSFLLLSACVTTYDTIGNRDFASKYNPSQANLHPEYTIYQISPNEHRLYFRFYPVELAYRIIDKDSVPKANVKLFFRVTKDYNSVEIIDSLSTQFKLAGKPRPQFLGYVPINFPEDGYYALEVFLVDLIARNSVSQVIDVQVKKEGNENSYLMLSQYGNPLFRNYFAATDSIRMRSDMFNSNGLNIIYYPADEKIPITPDEPVEIYLDPYPADTSYHYNYPDTNIFSFHKKGLFVFSGSEQLVGKTYLCVDDNFPYINTPEKMLKALGYLCSDKEMKDLLKMETAKIAVDTFWLEATNDVDKARELIRVYYNRVQLANYFFTDYKEGWLTDRGMIYIMFGAPARVTKSEQGEFWIYGKGATDEMKFYFYKDKHPVFGYTFVLDRSDLYTRIWFNAVTAWREGRAFTLNP